MKENGKKDTKMLLVTFLGIENKMVAFSFSPRLYFPTCLSDELQVF